MGTLATYVHLSETNELESKGHINISKIYSLIFAEITITKQLQVFHLLWHDKIIIICVFFIHQVME